MRVLGALIDNRISLLHEFRDSCSSEIVTLAEALIDTFKQQRKLLICGNGGSAADSQHLAAEFISSFTSGFSRRSLPAISLSVDTSVLTAISNDFDFEQVFSRQIQGLGEKNDSLLVLSTSGKSRNCISAVETARNTGMRVFSLTRKDSPLYKMSDVGVGVPSQDTQHIQECHVIAYHLLAQLVDEEFSKEDLSL